MALLHSTSRAEALRTRCATTPEMNLFQPITASALEVRRAAAANPAGNHTTRMENLAAFVVDQTERAVNGMEMATLPLPEDTVRILERVEAKLDEVRRVIENIAPRSKGKLVKDFALMREIRRLKAELKSLINALVRAFFSLLHWCIALLKIFSLQLKDTHKLPSAESAGISPMELANLSIRTAAAIFDAPPLNFLKPVAGIAQIISETAQTVKSNHSAALQLAAHSGMVTNAVAEHAAKLGPAVASNDEALVALQSVLENIHLYLTDLQKPRRWRRTTSWLMANKEKDRIAEFNQGLDKALALFTSTNVLATRAELREIATRGNGFVEEIATQVRMNTDVLTVRGLVLLT
ncbi:hypothetical protein MSAN_00339900 [Mycena sanguinolenta]|uniref:Uncharacterized protein n=1 Tax=Mycena sanguinolenta TaxID=230812 RepID=A0A8H6Z8L9_9AGAR|nr:hypothetical protein MSAN_00339900 [Mycena sanguinolenta]